MKVINTAFEGLKIIENRAFEDDRGGFQKLFQKSLLANQGIMLQVDEHFFSVSHRGVIRGLHFQLPPYPQNKLVYVIQGSVFDVAVDLRKSSKTFKKVFTQTLSENNRQALFIPEGFAHGFQSLSDNTIMVYLQSKEYVPEADSGINPLSAGVIWPIKDHIISNKDQSHISLIDFDSPF